MEVRKAVRDDAPASWTQGLKRYVEAKVGFEFWFRIGKKPHPRYYRAHLQRAAETGDGMKPLVPAYGRHVVNPHDEMGGAVLVVVPESVEDKEWAPLGVPSMLRLERLRVFDDGPGGRTERFDLPELAFPLIGGFADWEFCIGSWAQRVNEVVEARAKAVDAIPDDKLQVVWERCRLVDDVLAIADALRVRLRDWDPVVKPIGV